MAECLLLALSGHRLVHRKCPLSGVKQTCLFALHMSAFDPSGHAVRTWYSTRRSELSASGSFLVAQHRCRLFYL